tara:strand:+ start:69 stop:668 length:600 start_codon:yes stop_codon:yes gene_type:complete
MPRKSSKKNFRKSSKKNLEDFMPMSSKLTTRLVARPSQSSPSNKRILIASIVGSIIGIIININALIWLQKLEKIKCACSEHWMRNYIKYYLYVIIPMFFIGLIINIYAYVADVSINEIHNNDLFILYRSFAGIVSLFGFANIFIVIIFINRLKELNCECSEDIKREVYWVYNILLATIIALTILFMLVGLPLALMTLRR